MDTHAKMVKMSLIISILRITNSAIVHGHRALVANLHMNYTQPLSAGQPAQDSAASSSTKPSNLLLLPALVLVSAFVWLAAQGGFYTPGDDFGYYIGLAGAQHD